MEAGAPASVTGLLEQWSRGNDEAAERLMPLVYGELRRMAAGCLRRERDGHTLDPTALVHEAYLRLVGQRGVDWQGRSQFYAIAAKMMRRVLVDHARSRLRQKRGAGVEKVPFEQLQGVLIERPADVVALDLALEDLSALDPGKVAVVELRFFAGLSVVETAAALGCSAPTVVRHWRLARAWLRRRLKGGPGGGS